MFVIQFNEPSLGIILQKLKKNRNWRAKPKRSILISAELS